MTEAEIGSIKKKYIADRIKASVDTFGDHPQFYGSIITTVIVMLALLVSKVLRKAAGLPETFPDTRQEHDFPPEPRPTTIPKTQKQPEPQIPPQPEMSAEAAEYPKLQKIYKELFRKNETIFEVEKKRNALEEKQVSLKGLSKLTKKGKLQSETDQINERIDLLKVSLSGIVKRYSYQTVQDFKWIKLLKTGIQWRDNYPYVPVCIGLFFVKRIECTL